MTTIPTQIRARLDAIAAERASLHDEELRLKKALEALEPTAEPSEAPGWDDRRYPSPDEILKCVLDAMKVETPPCATMPYPVPHYPFQPLRHPGYDISGTVIEGMPESQFSNWRAPPWHTVTGKACSDVVTAEDLNRYD